MLELIQAIPFAFAALFPVVNPIGSSVIFLAMVEGSSPKIIHRLAIKIAIYMSVMLTVVLFAGSFILRLFGITIPIVLIGGGFVIAYIGWQLLNKSDTLPEKSIPTDKMDATVEQMSFYPLTMPITAGPGCIAVAIAVGAHSIVPSWETTSIVQLGNAIGIFFVGVTVFFCYRYAYGIAHKLGESGTKVIMRLAAFINLCIGLQIMWHGVKSLLASG